MAQTDLDGLYSTKQKQERGEITLQNTGVFKIIFLYFC